MVEIYSLDRQICHGSFLDFKHAKNTLNCLLAAGKITGEIPSVIVDSYKCGRLERTYVATYSGRWRVPKQLKTPKPISRGEIMPKRQERTRKKRDMSRRCFREGLPEWLVKPMPVFM